MCGIFAYYGPKTNAAELTLIGLKKLEYRGYDSWGIAVKSSQTDHLEIEKHIGKISQAQTILPEGSLSIGHTRWATHGGVTEANAHPHLSRSGDIAVVHNGIVENYRDLRNKLIKQGYTFLSETDTEIIAHLIEDFLKKDNDFSKAVMMTMNSLIGSNALVAINKNTNEIVACRDGSPLIAGIGENEFIIASDVVPIIPFTNSCYFLQDGETVAISHEGVRCYDTKQRKEKKITPQTMKIKELEADKKHYPHFMLKEIVDQKETIDHVLQQKKSHSLKKDTQLIFTGCGTAYHCCLYGVYLAARAGIAAKAIPANEFEPFINTLNKNTTVIAISQSGETADTIIAAKAAKKAGAHLFSIVNVAHSTLARLSDEMIDIDAGPELAVVSTKAFTAQAAALHTLFSSNNHITIHPLLSPWIDTTGLKQAYDIARTLIDAHDIFVIGKHELYPIALETALKIKEASYIHAEGFAAGELKHGVIALIEKGTPCIVIDDGGTFSSEIASSATQLKSRGGYIIGISPKKNDVFDIWFQIPEAGNLTPLVAAIAGQLIGYTASVGKGCDPDKPRNLAKSVTVK